VARCPAVAAENAALNRQLGRPIHSSTVACLVTARRAPHLTRAELSAVAWDGLSRGRQSTNGISILVRDR
jgi:hypothetical protein